MIRINNSIPTSKNYVEEHFNIDLISSIEVRDKMESSYKWLPRKQKTWFFGLMTRDSWYSEGFYRWGLYDDGDEIGSWEVSSYTKEELEKEGYIVDSDKIVWHRPRVDVYLTNRSQVIGGFDTLAEARAWVENLKSKSDKKFEVIIKR